MIVQLVTTFIARLRLPWRDAARIGIAVMVLFTGASHFSSMKTEMAAMIPPPLTGALWAIYMTSMLEIAGAIGLLISRFRRLAGICLAALLVVMFSANIYAALNGVTLRGKPQTTMWFRAPMQVFWIATLLWSAVVPVRSASEGVQRRNASVSPGPR